MFDLVVRALAAGVMNFALQVAVSLVAPFFTKGKPTMAMNKKKNNKKNKKKNMNLNNNSNCNNCNNCNNAHACFAEMMRLMAAGVFRPQGDARMLFVFVLPVLEVLLLTGITHMLPLRFVFAPDTPLLQKALSGALALGLAGPFQGVFLDYCTFAKMPLVLVPFWWFTNYLMQVCVCLAIFY